MSDFREMKPLSHEDEMHLRTATGWIELNNPVVAFDELERISPLQRAHLGVLNIRLMAYALARKWEFVSEIAAELCKKNPDSVFAWLVRANCLHQSGCTEEAIELLLCIAPKTAEYKVRFDLARYCCSLGKLEQGKEWLRQAFDLNPSKELKIAALDEPYFGAFWPAIEIAGL